MPDEAMRPSGSGAYEFTTETSLGCEEVRIRCLGDDYGAVVVSTLALLETAVDSLAAIADEDHAVFVDGEFAPLCLLDGQEVQRMELLQLHASGSDKVFLLHFPSLFGRWQTAGQAEYKVPPETQGVPELYALLRSSDVRKTWWDGTSNDAPALLRALPGAAPLSGFRDLQADVISAIRSGELPLGTPIGLGPMVETALGVHMDKTMQLADWRSLPDADMAAYAACDAIVLRSLADALDRGALQNVLAPKAPELKSAALRAGKARAWSGDYVSGVTSVVIALMGHGASPEYTEVSRSGPSHDPVFSVALFAPGLAGTFVGEGRSMKGAKQAAAKAAWAALVGDELVEEREQPGRSEPTGASLHVAAAPTIQLTSLSLNDLLSEDDDDDTLLGPVGHAEALDVWSPVGPGAQKCRDGDFVSGLHEWAQRTSGVSITFDSAERTGPAHCPIFRLGIVVKSGNETKQIKRYMGVGCTVKAAKNEARKRFAGR
ncbi:hypothetical protein T492DRAFT_1002667 [Pavlovales sp. CCMP2436]|nr:hypothetical protein T492DRAFT_1002667 [Pavlovales sp. CCMP2436]|mmetsp:Transcript_45095/g.111808  ORF Transcript_45095/g.111808 Transcript_45095/m.111808 type:complete len:489 (-) Transcript_45095:124-1590(-)